MRYRALATDYDGTIAYEGQVDESTLAALKRVKDRGLGLLMVTGRELSDLFNTFPHADLFDRIVAENGAVVYEPDARAVVPLAPAPPPELIDILKRQHIPLSVGHSIVATVSPHEHAVLAAIRELGIEWHVIFNKGSVMALPSDVTKTTGLAQALEALGLTHEQIIGVGDAENDQVFLRACGLSAAVGNALPAVKEAVHVVTVGARGAGVAELIDRWLSGELDRVDTARRA